MIKYFVRDLTRYLPAKIVPAFVGFISIPIITRFFSPEDYGNYIITIATVNILVIIIGWINMAIIRFYPAYERDGQLPEFFNTTIKLLLLSEITIGFIFICIIFFLKPLIKQHLFRLLLIGTVLFIFLAAFQVLLHFLRAKRKATLYSSFFSIYSVSKLIFGIVLVVVFSFNIEGFIWGAVLSLIILLPILWKTNINASFFNTKINIKLIKEMAMYSFPLVAGNLAAWILSISDRYLLEYFRDSSEVGIYSVSYAITEHSILFIASIFLLASSPIEMNIWEKQKKNTCKEFLSKLTRYYILLSIPAVVGLSVLAKPLISTITTEDYLKGYKIIPLVAIGVFFLGLQRRFQSGLAFHKKTKIIMIVTVIAGILNFGLNFLLIPKYGYLGAAFTTLLSYSFLLLFIIITSRKYFIWKFPFRSLGNSIFASLIMAIIVYPIGSNLTSSIKINLIFGTGIGIFIYVLMIFLLKEIKKNELFELRSIFKL